MPTRAEASAATRRALLDAAAGLLDAGGVEAVTLREVGLRAGVTRSAPYRHFADKEGLLAAVAAEAWDKLTDTMAALEAGPNPRDRVRAALLAVLNVARAHPHLYQVMFTPAGSASAVAQAGARAQQTYLRIVSSMVGDEAAWQYGGMLLTSIHGMAGLERSGFLVGIKWLRAEELLDLLVDRLPRQVGPR